MNIFKFEALKKEFPFIDNCDSQPSRPDDVKIRRLDENTLMRRYEDIAPRDEYWDGAAGDSYHEITAFVIFGGSNKVSYDYEARMVLDTPLETIYAARLYEPHLTPAYILVCEEEGGYGVARNVNEFGYGEERRWTIYKASKFDKLDELIKDALKKAELEVKREADF